MSAMRGALTDEQARVLERYQHQFPPLRRSSRRMLPRSRLAEIGQRLATLGTAFSQNVLADERDYMLVLEGEADLAGLPDFLRAAARQGCRGRAGFPASM